MKNRPWTGFLLTALPVAFLIIFVGVPMVGALLYSLGDAGGINSAISQIGLDQVISHHGLTLKVYSGLIRTPAFVQDLIATIWVTVACVALIVVISWAIALYMRFATGFGARILSVLYVVPMFIPVVISSYALVSFWNDGGFIAAVMSHLGFPNFPSPGYTLVGIIIAQVWASLPFAALMLSSGLKAIPDSQIEAARDIGASGISLVWRVLVPQNMLSTIIVITFSTIGILGSFTIPYLTGPNAPQMLGVAMYSYFSTYNEPQQSQAMAILLFLLSMGIGYFYVRANVRADRKGSLAR